MAFMSYIQKMNKLILFLKKYSIQISIIVGIAIIIFSVMYSLNIAEKMIQDALFMR